MVSTLNKTDEIVEQIRHGTAPINSLISFPCGICHKKANKAIFCDQCEKWIQSKCSNISDREYETLKNEPDDKQWVCLKGTILHNSLIFPFTLESDLVLLGLNEIDIPSLTESLPSFEISSRLANLPNLSDYDADAKLECQY